MKKKRRITLKGKSMLTVYIDTPVKEQFARLAQRDQRTLSGEVNYLISLFIREHETPTLAEA